MSFAERLILENNDSGDIIENEHLVRYQFASKFVNNKKVLDIACGSGYGTKILATAGASEAVGVDCDAETIHRNRALTCSGNLIYREGEAINIPAKDREFDVVVSFETIEHLSATDQDKFVFELARVISDDGLVFVSTPNLTVFGNKNPYHIKELTRSEFQEILKKYFPFAVILEPGNGIVSFIRPTGDQEIKSVKITSSSEPLYFVAVCSKREITENGFKGEGVGSVSVKAYNRLKNNPILRLSNKIYPLVKFFFKK